MTLDEILRTARKQFLPPGKLSPSVVADRERRLSPEAAAEPGRWQTGRAEYQRGMLDAAVDSKITIYACGAQLGKTELLLNFCLSWITQDAGPILIIQPTLAMAEAFSRDRLGPMIRDTPKLAALFPKAKSRVGGQTALRREFPGGTITIIGANAPASLASRPIRYVLADEVDRYPINAAGEGDPLALGMARQQNFHNRRAVIASTPTTKGQSRIWAALEESDWRLFEIACPHCKLRHALEWAGVKWDAGEPKSARFVCPAGHEYSEREKNEAVPGGVWRATRPGSEIAGFRINSLASPWVKLSDLVALFLGAKDAGADRLRAFCNLQLAEVWEESQSRLEIGSLMQRTESYGAEVPAPVLTLTAGVDVQQDRLEVEIVGHGLKDNQWGIGYHVLEGQTVHLEVWDALEKLLAREYRKASGEVLKVQCAAVDAGFNTATVAPWCAARGRLGIVAVRGSVVKTAPPILRARGRRDGLAGFKYLVGVHLLKEFLFHKLRAGEKSGNSVLHWPDDGRGYELESYWLGLCSEELRVVKRRGYAMRAWVQTRERNEPLDARIYSIAALHILAPAWRRGGALPAVLPAAVPALRKGLPAFVNSWRL